MIAAIQALLTSRKFVLVLVGTIVAIAARLGFEVDTEVVGMIVGLFAVAIGAIAHEDAAAKSAAVTIADVPPPKADA